MKHAAAPLCALIWPVSPAILLILAQQQHSYTDGVTATTWSSSGSCFPSSDGGRRRSYRNQPPTGWRSPKAGAADLEDKEMRRIFDAVDEDSDGRITHTELANFVRKLNLSDCRHFGDHIKAILESADKNGDGVLEYAEFVELCESLNAVPEEYCGELSDAGEEEEEEEDQGLLDAFHVFDNDNDGFISPRELQAVVSCFRSDRGLKDCSRMIKAVDKDGDGLVNFQEFKEMMQFNWHDNIF